MIEKEKEKRDVIANNRKTDLSEYKRIVEVLGEDKAPVSFPQFQKMKYNDLEGYERLKDRVFIQNNFNKGIWLDKINQEKQARHMQASAGVGKSYFYDDVDVEELYNKYKMTG
ncbi:hypothetical protein D3H64_10030, partial [Atopobacter sp. AH10]|uniref:polymorphic toxin type 50 domain-containing protein n=1 Tax=Atopobacter sp. AH10 TaxID=2315861 RepID=UPI000FF2D303